MNQRKHNAIMRLLIPCFCLLLFPAILYGEYPVSDIPADLLTDANRVYRLNNMDITITGPGKFKITREVVITLMNENGKGPEILVINYDLHTKANFIDGAVYDANGERITKVRGRDLLDVSNFQDFSLFEDSRALVYQPKVSTYPYTVHYKYEEEHTRGFYYSRKFGPIPSYNTSCEKASMKIIHPIELGLMYRTHKIDMLKEFEEQTTGDNVLKQWNFSNQSAVMQEYSSPGFDKAIPWIMFATERFEYAGYEGSSQSWIDYGKWIYTLIAGRDQLPAERQQQLKEMVAGLPNGREKVKAVYEFMQSRTRYVNVALGIGGMQPADATTVDQVGYGDCKALSNYMKAMLKVIGIDSYYTAVSAGLGDYSIVEDFAVSQFNHVILCVPLEKDTVWLECTSQTTPFGHLGDFTDNRPVLIIREDGGHLARTPAYEPHQNLIKTRGEIQIDRQGNGKGELFFSRGGIFFTDIDHAARLSPDDQKKWIYKAYSFPNYTLENYQVKAIASDDPVVEIKLDVALRSFANITGQRLFVPLNAISTEWRVPPRERNRSQPLSLKFPMVYCDTIYFHIPAGYKPESTLQPIEMDSEFGRFSASYIFGENTLLYVRKLEMYAGIFEPEKYQEFFRFYQQIARINNQSVAFVK